MILILLGLGLIGLGFFLIKMGLKLVDIIAIIFLVFVFLCCSGACVQAYEYTPEEIVLIAKVVHHEAGNQPEIGKRLVCDTILNRVESERFPNTVKEVLDQPGQYCNPKKFPPDDYIYTIIAQEIYKRTNNQVYWYKTKGYHKYGTPILQEGSHFFSGGE